MQSIDTSHLAPPERIRIGRKNEEHIFNLMEQKGFTIKKATDYEDKFDKIDVYFGVNQNQLRSMQVKCRNGEDIGLEVTHLDDKKLNPKKITVEMPFDGRDFISKSELYACLSKDKRVIRVCEMNELKFYADKTTRILLRKYLSTGQRTFCYRYGKACIVEDPYSKRRKILFFAKADPTIIKSLKFIQI